MTAIVDVSESNPSAPMIFDKARPDADPLRAAVRNAYRADEAAVVRSCLDAVSFNDKELARINARSSELVEAVRRDRVASGGIDAFMHEYELSSNEGVVLMCLAEALLRIPDAETADLLIKDKIGGADWDRHLGLSESLFVNASTWALMLTGRVVNLEEEGRGEWRGLLTRMIARSGEPVIRQAVTQAMRILGRQFVMGRTIGEALKRAESSEARGYRYTYDMLGEAARTLADAERYFESYTQAIQAIGAVADGRGPIEGPGISVKLSALHPRFEFAKSDRVMAELRPRLAELARLAAGHGIGLCVDSEESERLEPTLDLLDAVAADPALGDWDGFGFALQAYQKRALPLVDWLADRGRRNGRRLMVRLVKGAYWDAEVKHAQELGQTGYPVFTRKVSTDVSYLACAARILKARDALYPAFATHNAHTLAAVLELAGDDVTLEFQRLHGMGEALYDQVVGPQRLNIPCRVYAPVGSHEDLLAYLVRRLLENGSNTSFVNRIVDEELPLDDIVADPLERARALDPVPHPKIPLPRDLFGDERRNSNGIDLTDVSVLRPLAQAMADAAGREWFASPIVAGARRASDGRLVTDPSDRRRTVGSVAETTPELAREALEQGLAAQPAWDAAGGDTRAACLERAADLYEAHDAELMTLAVREAGKTLPDAVAELREAVDFLRYYAQCARRDFAGPVLLPGPTGESNTLALHGRGVFVCISPWNFPLAIFTGQIAAALVAGNAVLAKPAEQTPLIADRAVRLLHEAGVPDDVLHLLPGDGPSVAGPLLGDARIGGVAFTGSTETARLINRQLADRDGPIVPLIAETGGQNAMIVDSSALPEQVTRDVLASAFQSAGQRCSALRVLYVQDEIADYLIRMLDGATRELAVGDPGLLSTDIGPVIDAEALEKLESHGARMEKEATLLFRGELGPNCDHGTYFAPCAFAIPSMTVLEREVFGPVLHVVRYRAADLESVVDEINRSGYGLTVSVHSRIESTVDRVLARLRVGNAYVNRNQIGAVVGVQPFGGEGLSGTGPKAGGPRYLYRFATERAVSVDTTAAGGNAALMSLEEGA